jgi:hypothetical protein
MARSTLLLSAAVQTHPVLDPVLQQVCHDEEMSLINRCCQLQLPDCLLLIASA